MKAGALTRCARFGDGLHLLLEELPPLESFWAVAIKG